MKPRRNPSLAMVGLTWREAPTSLRSVAAAPLTGELWAGLVAQGARGMVEVHTCARSLWLVEADDAGWTGAILQSLVESRLQHAGAAVSPALLLGDEAVRALIGITIGLDSFVEGEADVGTQVHEGFAASSAAGRAAPEIASLARVTSRLAAEARRSGVVRRGRGMGQLAVDNLAPLGVPPGAPVGVVGAGRIGSQVRGSVERAGLLPVMFNRTPRADLLPLDAIVGTELSAIIICTSAPAAWFVPPAGIPVVDLGRPAQVAGPAVCLDTILSGPGLRLDGETRALAQAMVERAMAEWAAHEQAHAARARLARVQALRDQFVQEEIEVVIAAAVADLDAATRRRVVAAARHAVRRYSHAVIGALKEET